MARRLSRRSLAQYVATALMSGADQKTIVRQLAAYLVENRRTEELGLILKDVQYYLAENGYVSGTVTSAFGLDDATKTAITTMVKRRTGAGHVTLDNLINPAVLGGVKISLPGRELDDTIAHHLTTLRTQYKKA